MPAEAPRPITAGVLAFTALAMLAFAGNSLLCRLALKQSGIDAATFTSVRLVAGALTLATILRLRGSTLRRAGDWASAVALFAYAAGFSWAYVSLPTATGALVLFGAVQITMIAHGLWRGERLRPVQTIGIVAAAAGLVVLLAPGAHAPSASGSMLMAVAGIAWGVYSLRGRGAGDPIAVTAGNFWRASLLAVACSLCLFMIRGFSVDVAGLLYAIASGALASGVGYSIWYTAVRGLPSTSAAVVQLTVPVIAAAGAVGLLGEPITPGLVLSSVIVLGGVALVILARPPVT